MMMPMLWMEARCNGFMLLGIDWEIKNCRETIASGWANNGRGIHKLALERGSHIVNGDYVCSHCFKKHKTMMENEE